MALSLNKLSVSTVGLNQAMYKIISYVIPNTILPQFHCVAVLSFQKVSMRMSTDVTTASNKSTNQADPQVFWALKLEKS